MKIEALGQKKSEFFCPKIWIIVYMNAGKINQEGKTAYDY